MAGKHNLKFCLSKKSIGVISLAGILLILLIGLFLSSNGTLFQGNLDPDLNLEKTTICKSLKLKTIPSPLRANTGAIIIIETDPDSIENTITVSASSGSLAETEGESGSYINTKEKILSYSGGESGSRITAQISGTENCADSIFIKPVSNEKCQNLQITTEPSPLSANQSAEIKINTLPENWQGQFFLLSETGKFQLSQKDQNSTGENTNTMVTTLKDIIYTGGAPEETITIKALGEGNENCAVNITIEK